MRLRFLFLFLILATTATNVRADDSDDSAYVNYDSLVSELKASAEEPAAAPSPTDWEDVAIHLGAGIVTSFVDVTSPEGINGAGVLKGFEAHAGANLFSKKARAEMLFRNYASEPLSSTLSAHLREFELRLVFIPIVRDKMRVRAGAGFAARYMDLRSRSFGRIREHSTSTPASTFMVGFERKLTHSVSVGPDLSYRSAVISETFDKSAWDASLRINATF